MSRASSSAAGSAAAAPGSDRLWDSPLGRRLLGLGIWSLVVALWEWLTQSGNAPDYLVAPSAIVVTLARLAADGEL
ncbi:MAG TPA: hypothetical protein VN832_04795, partial [Stellaceae bacterium]|nr:hypothetical protein [Stellaceae bacterium]